MGTGVMLAPLGSVAVPAVRVKVKVSVVGGVPSSSFLTGITVLVGLNSLVTSTWPSLFTPLVIAAVRTPLSSVTVIVTW